MRLNKETHPALVTLRVKIKSLAHEARIIRAEEQKAKAMRRPWLFKLLYWHRIGDVRYHARYAQLAYGYMRGVPYRVIERKTKASNGPASYRLLLKELKPFVSMRDSDSGELDATAGARFISLEADLKEWMEAKAPAAEHKLAS